MNNIINYWQLDPKTRVEIIKATKTIPIIPGFRDYTVNGEIKGIKEYFCDCVHCEGHREVDYLLVNEDVYANDSEQAIQKAIDALAELDEYSEWEWKQGPTVTRNRA